MSKISISKQLEKEFGIPFTNIPFRRAWISTDEKYFAFYAPKDDGGFDSEGNYIISYPRLLVDTPKDRMTEFISE